MPPPWMDKPLLLLVLLPLFSEPSKIFRSNSDVDIQRMAFPES